MKKSGPSDKQDRRTAAFGDVLIAAMLDAAVERKLCQFVAEITPEETGRVTRVRVIVVPEQMDREFPQGLEADDDVPQGTRGN